MDVLGHTLDLRPGKKTIDPKESRVADLLTIPYPTTTANLQQYLAVCNYMRQHLGAGYAEQAKILTTEYARLMQGKKQSRKAGEKVKFTDNPELRQAFEQVRSMIGRANPLSIPVDELETLVITDASEYGCGGVILQVPVHVWEQIQRTGKMPDPETCHTLAWVSKSFDKTKLGWSTVEKEAFGAYHLITRYAHLLFGKKFHVIKEMHAFCTNSLKRTQITRAYSLSLS